MDIKALQKIVWDFRDERDRKQFHNPKDLSMAISIEVSELQEHFLRKSQEDSYWISKTPEAIDEFADIMNFLLLYADAAWIDIENAVVNKIEKSAKKYPVNKAKGKSTKYTKL
jgi:NTP pyrophosphatase (non-canonical NTP hydrolase)